MNKQYLLNMAKSFANQEKSITIPPEKLGEPIFLGFQPEGIASVPKDGYDLVAIANYFMPAICLVKVKITPEGLKFFDFEWIRGVKHGIQSVRLFPDIVRGGDANRAQTVNFGPNGTLWVSRNGDPERSFFVLSPPENEGGKWSLTDKILLPPHHDMAMIHSALLSPELNAFYTIESSADLYEWRLIIYSITSEGKRITYGDSDEIEPFTYGIDSNIKGLLTITDFRYTEKRGIYRDYKLAVPSIFGNGITALSDGSALVSVGGTSCPGPFDGQPGMLVYISKEQLGG